MMSHAELVGTGVIMGIIHVLTGPDHLSAMATLSGTNMSSECSPGSEAFLLGVRWGIGHSLGLLVVASILIAMEPQASTSEWIGMDASLTYMLESLVGVFMLVLGSYGLHRARRNRAGRSVSPLLPSPGSSRKGSQMLKRKGSSGADSKKRGAVIDEEVERSNIKVEIVNMPLPHGGAVTQDESADNLAAMMEEVLDHDGSRHEPSMDRRDSDITSEDDAEASIVASLPKAPPGASLTDSFTKFQRTNKHRPSLMRAQSLLRTHAVPDDTLDPLAKMRRGKSISMWRRCGAFFGSTPGILALMAGMVHGVAGPGGVLGVVPAVQLRDPALASLYLGVFCVASTLAMGGFAAWYGTFCEWMAGGRKGSSTSGSNNRVFMVEAGSAFLSIAVGIIWLVLLSIGGLEEVFP